MGIRSIHFDLNYLGFKVGFHEFMSFSYTEIHFYIDKMNETKEREKKSFEESQK